jgi:hypothetical protein
MLKTVRPAVVFLLGAAAMFATSQPDAFPFIVGSLSLPLASGFFGAWTGKRLGSAQFAGDATDAGAVFGTLQLLLKVWLRDHPIAYVPPPAFGGFAVIAVAFAFVAVLFGLTQLYAYTLFRMRRTQQRRRATA